MTFDTTVVDVAMVALYNLVSSQMALIEPDVLVLDGPSVDDVGQDVIAIGLTAEQAVTDAAEEVRGLYVQQETFDLECLVRSWTGDDDLPARRTRAFGLLRGVAAIIRGHSDLGGSVTRARLSGVSYHPARLPEGAVASVTFKVRIEAFTS